MKRGKVAFVVIALVIIAVALYFSNAFTLRKYGVLVNNAHFVDTEQGVDIVFDVENVENKSLECVAKVEYLDRTVTGMFVIGPEQTRKESINLDLPKGQTSVRITTKCKKI